MYVRMRTAGLELPGEHMPMYRRPGLFSTERWTEKKSSSTSSALGGKIARRRMNTLRTWSAARRTVAVEATTFGRTLVLPSCHEQRSSTAVS